MTCEQARALLDDFVDGELEECAFQEMELHLASCAACAQQATALRALVDRAAALPRSLAPERDLWPDVAAEIRPALPVARMPQWQWQRPWVWGALAAAAAITLAMFVGRAERVRPAPSHANAAQVAALEADRDYERAAADLLAAVAGRRDRLTPEGQARVDESLHVIAQALAAIRVQLAKDPSDPALNHLLLSVHQKRIEVLRALVQLTT